MSYDSLNRVTSVSEPFGLSLAFQYDAVDNRTSVTDSLGGTTTSQYDAGHRLTNRTLTASGQALRLDFTYTSRNQVATATRSKDAAGTQKVGESSSAYDDVGRLLTLQHKDGGTTTLATYAYAYDLGGRLTSETVNGTATTYQYDATNQLTQAGATAYSYDANGNRTTSGYTTGAGNRLTNDGTWAYTYDDEGNLTKKSKGTAQETWTYAYDHRNQLTRVEKRASDGGALQQSTDCAYDAFGNRLEKVLDPDGAGSQGSLTTRYAQDGWDVQQSPTGRRSPRRGNEAWDVWADTDGGNALTTRYLRGDAVDELFARVSSGGTAAWYLTDRQGTVRDLTDGNGALQDHRTYDGYGNLTAETNPSFGDRYGYTGREFEAEVGLQYNRARSYDPRLGRWTSQDPIGFQAGDANLYRYVHNSPTNATDPTGEWLLLKNHTAVGRWEKYLEERYGLKNVKGLPAQEDARGGRWFLLVPPENRDRVLRLLARHTDPTDYDHRVLVSLFANDYHLVGFANLGILWPEDTRTRVEGKTHLFGGSPEPPLSIQERARVQSILDTNRALAYQGPSESLVALAQGVGDGPPVPPPARTVSPTPAGQLVAEEPGRFQEHSPGLYFAQRAYTAVVQDTLGALNLPKDLALLFYDLLLSGKAQEALAQWSKLSPSQRKDILRDQLANAASEVIDDPGKAAGHVLFALASGAVTKANASQSLKGLGAVESYDSFNALRSKEYTRHLDGKLLEKGLKEFLDDVKTFHAEEARKGARGVTSRGSVGRVEAPRGFRDFANPRTREAAIRARELVEEAGLERYGQFRNNSSAHVQRQFTHEELLLMSERHNVEFRQMVIQQADGSERIVILAGERGRAPAAPALPGERVVRDWHTHPGHRNSTPSLADGDSANSLGCPCINISRDRTTGRVVIGGTLPVVP